MDRPAPACALTRALCIFTLATLAGLAGGCSTPSSAYVLKGDKAYARGDYEMAAVQYEKAITTRGANTEARMGMARASLKLGEPAHAREQAEMVYAVYPQDPEVLDLLAETLVASGDVAGMQSLLLSNAQSSNQAADWHRLGRFLLMAGDIDEAKQAMLMAARVDRGQTAKYQVALAELYAKAGDFASAKERYKMALYVDPLNEEVRSALRRMGEIPGPTIAIPPAELAAAE